MRFRSLLVVLAVVLLAVACGDDGGETTEPVPTIPPQPPTTPTVAGPTEGQVACARLAERYVRQARRIFEHEGTPSDALVDRIDRRLSRFDAIATTAGCGDEYRNGVCDGLDDLTHQGILVIMPLLPPNGCGA